MDSKLTEEQKRQGLEFLKQILDKSPNALLPAAGGSLAQSITLASEELAKYFLCIKN